MKLLKKIDKNLERWVMFVLLAGMTLVLGIRYSAASCSTTR